MFHDERKDAVDNKINKKPAFYIQISHKSIRKPSPPKSRAYIQPYDHSDQYYDKLESSSFDGDISDDFDGLDNQNSEKPSLVIQSINDDFLV